MRWRYIILALVSVAVLACDDGGEGVPATCDELSRWCARCSSAETRQSCDSAVASNDDATCRSTLHSAEIQNNCNPNSTDASGDLSPLDTTPSPDTTPPPDTSPLDTTPPPDTGTHPDMVVLEPCEELELMCPKCTLLNLKEICEDYITLDDPALCITAMADPDIQRNCL